MKNSNLIDLNVIESFYKEILLLLEKDVLFSFKINFFIKNYGRPKYMPMRKFFIQNKITVNYKEFVDYKNIFNNFLENREFYKYDSFKTALEKIELEYKRLYEFKIKKKQNINEFQILVSSIRNVFPGSYRKGLYITTFLRNNFSFTLKKFTDYNFEAYTTKDFKIVISDFKINSAFTIDNKKIEIIKSNYPILFENSSEVYYNPNCLGNLILKYFFIFIRSKIKNKFIIRNIDNLLYLKTFQRDVYFLNTYGFYIKDKRILSLDKKFLTIDTYKLHYKLLNLNISGIIYNKGIIRIHPLEKLFPKLNIKNYSIENLNFLSIFLLDCLDKNPRYFTSILVDISEFIDRNIDNLFIYLSFYKLENFYIFYRNLNYLSYYNGKLLKWHMNTLLKSKLNLKVIFLLKKRYLLKNLEKNVKKDLTEHINIKSIRLKNLYFKSLFCHNSNFFTVNIELNKNLFEEEQLVYYILNYYENSFHSFIEEVYSLKDSLFYKDLIFILLELFKKFDADNLYYILNTIISFYINNELAISKKEIILKSIKEAKYYTDFRKNLSNILYI